MGKQEGVDNVDGAAEQTGGGISEEEYNRLWAEANKAAGAKDGAPAGEKREQGDAGTAGLPGGAPDREGERVPEGAEAPASKTFGSVEAMEKAIKDSHTKITTLASEKAELEKKLEAFERGEATKQEVDAQKKAVQKAQDRLASLDSVKAAVYEDYPELKDLIDPLIDMNRELTTELSAFKAERTKAAEARKLDEARTHYETEIRPRVLAVHSDHDAILFARDGSGAKTPNPDYFGWAEKQRPALRFAAMDSSDPEDIIWAMSEYKKHKASPAARELREHQEQERTNRLAAGQTLRGGSSPFPARSKAASQNPDSTDGAWEEAGKLLKQQGIG